MKCQKCGIDLPSNNKFCHKCGTPIFPCCKECGAELEPDSQFCGMCGASTAEKTEKKGYWKCWNCEHEREEGNEKCPKCGSAPTPEAEAVRTAKKPAAKKPAVKKPANKPSESSGSGFPFF